MKRAIVASLLLCGLILMGGAIRPDKDPGFGDQMEIGFRGGNSEVDTFRILSKNTTYPNSAAKAAGYVYTDTTRYTTINTATGLTNVAQGVRVGYVTRDSLDAVKYFAAASNYAITGKGSGNILGDAVSYGSGSSLAFVWVSANGLTNGQRIEEAYLNINTGAFGLTIPSGQTLAARLDTISADYRVTAATAYGVGTCNNYAQFRMSWNSPNKLIGAAWSPTLDARNDWHDFGPRSNNVIPAGTYVKGTTLHLNVTNAVQQASDNGTLGRGLLFVIVINGGTTIFDVNAGFNATFVGEANNKGWPCFTAVATSRRGQQPWRGIRVPVAFQFDDAYNAQVGYFRALEDSGLIFSAAACSSNVYSHAWADSLYQLKPNNFYFINHTRGHASLGALTAGQLAFNMNRTWFPQRLTGFPDTTAVVDYALAGGGGVDSNADVVAALVGNGYRSMRSGGFDWNTTTQGAGFAHDTRLSWDGYIAKYQIWSVNARYIFGYSDQSREATQAEIKEYLTDYVDSYYTDYGKSALVMYAHWYAQGAPADWLSESNLRYFIGLTRQLNSCEIVNYRDLISQRLLGATVKTPAEVNAAARAGLVATADSAAIRKMSAKQDSVRLTDPTAYSNLLQIWVGPK